MKIEIIKYNIIDYKKDRLLNERMMRKTVVFLYPQISLSIII